MHNGDAMQVEALKRVYNDLLRKKEKYIEDVLQKDLTPRQYYHLDVGFRLLTLELKIVESKINYFKFGGELPVEQVPKSIGYYLNKHTAIKLDEDAYYNFISEISSLKQQQEESKELIKKLQNRLTIQYNLLWKYAPNKGKIKGLVLAKVER